MQDLSRSTTAVYQEGADSRTDLERLVDTLETVGSLEEFSEVVGGREIAIVEDAIAFAPTQPRRYQLSEWLVELSAFSLQPSTFNLQPSTEIASHSPLGSYREEVNRQIDDCPNEPTAHPPLDSYREGEEAWFYHPDHQDKWLKGVIEFATQSLIRVKAGFFGRMIGCPSLVAPGDWELIT